ncbi:DNA polymerase epsilon subunit Dpb3 [Histoplasma ohiense]|nr:DNA polymerase epsilon subunit Dpb3 [Histoplasma ohiense (nom. inval.)]
MTDQDNSYRPRSPDFSGFPGSLQLPPSPYGQTPYPLNSPLAHRASYDASPFFNPQAPQPQPQFQRAAQQYIPQPLDTNYSPHIMPPQTRSRAAAEQPPMDWHASPESPPAPENHSNNTRRTAPSQSSGGIEVRTKFPVARIKRIMQADEDVGKVAQVTPIAVSKALELFMISLVTKAAKEARHRSSKRVTAAHLKEAISKDEVLDFLADIISKVPDHSSGGKKDDDGSDQNDGRRKKAGGRRKKENQDDF